jgi:hypothetical protein
MTIYIDYLQLTCTTCTNENDVKTGREWPGTRTATVTEDEDDRQRGTMA